jgi:2-amino-4-hydroxy-6-hydroxymethyldihydropteridine diphosphokinase
MMPDSSHSAHLLIGSNIEPVENVRQALLDLCHFGILRRVSRVWQTPASGTDGPDFINLAVELVTPLGLESLKNDAIAGIESKLGRQRSTDKNAPRTIDLDVILFDGKLLDVSLWTQVYYAITIGELLPELRNPETGELLSTIAARLTNGQPVHERTDVLPQFK